MRDMRDVDFMNNVIVALSNEEMTKINFVDLEKLYNFVVEKFFKIYKVYFGHFFI